MHESLKNDKLRMIFKPTMNKSPQDNPIIFAGKFSSGKGFTNMME